MATQNYKLITTLLEALRAARINIKGVRTSHLCTALYLADMEGMRCTAIAKKLGFIQPVLFQRLKRARESGLIYQEYKRYYLTYKGKCVCKAVNSAMKEQLDAYESEVIRWVHQRHGYGK